MEQNEAFLKTTYNRYLLPTMLGILGGTVGVLSDGVLVGTFVGEAGLVIVNLCFPIQLMLSMLGSLIACGASVLAAREVGRKNVDASRRLFGTALILAIVASLMLTVLGSIFIEPLARLLAGNMNVDLVRPYTQILLIGALPKVLLYLPVYFLRLDGHNNRVTVLMLLMAGLNVVLDLLFLHVLQIGVIGAAWASVTATLLTSLCGFAFLFRKDSAFTPPLTQSRLTIVPALIKAGSPVALDNLAMALRIVLLNRILLLHMNGGVNTVLFAVITAVSEFSLFIIFGVPQTALPLVVVYSVEGSNGGIRLLMKRQLRIGLLFIFIFGAFILTFQSAIQAIFGVTESILIPIACLAIALLPALVNSVMAYYFQARGHVFLANAITLLRILLLPVLLVALLAANANDWLWLFLPLSELLTLTFWLLFVLRSSRRQQNQSRLLLLDDRLELSGSVLEFSVQSDAVAICDASARISEFCEQNAISPQQTMRISLAIEEILTVMAEQSLDKTGGSFDVRAFAVDGSIGLRIRCGGKRFNPLTLLESDELDESLLGLRLISGMAKKLEYLTTFGVNSFFVQIE